MSLFGKGGSEKREEHTVYGTGITGQEALDAAKKNLPPNATITSSQTYPLTEQTPVRAEIRYQLKPVPKPSVGHGAASPTPWEDMIYRATIHTGK